MSAAAEAAQISILGVPKAPSPLSAAVRRVKAVSTATAWSCQDFGDNKAELYFCDDGRRKLIEIVPFKYEMK